VDHWFEEIRLGNNLSLADASALKQNGFVVIPGPVSATQVPEIARAYDEVMQSAIGDDLKVGTTTTRLTDFVNRRPEFDGVYIFPPLLEACCFAMSQPFKASAILGRTLHPHAPSQGLHVDIPRGSPDGPLIGFILMIDDFRIDNGATCFVPRSQDWPGAPPEGLGQPDGLVFACGKAGSMIIFNGAVWHGHSANSTTQVRRSIQGYFVRREVSSGLPWRIRMLPETLERIAPVAKYILNV
jgi:hypothetical protein